MAIGMYQITRISEEQGLTKEGTAEEIRKILASYGLPVSCGVNLGELKEAMKRDKKNYKNSLRLILWRKSERAGYILLIFHSSKTARWHKDTAGKLIALSCRVLFLQYPKRLGIVLLR